MDIRVYKEEELKKLNAYMKSLEEEMEGYMQKVYEIEDELENLMSDVRALETLTSSDLVKEFWYSYWKEHRDQDLTK